jgi:hypothetical protein
VERIDRIGSTTVRTEWVPPVGAPGRVERRESDAERRRREQRRRPPADEADAEAGSERHPPVQPGSIDVTV